MSLEQAKKFIEQMKTDKTYWAKVMTVEDVAGRLRVAKAAGYDFTQEEIKNVSAELEYSDQHYVISTYSRCNCEDCDHWSNCG